MALVYLDSSVAETGETVHALIDLKSDDFVCMGLYVLFYLMSGHLSRFDRGEYHRVHHSQERG